MGCFGRGLYSYPLMAVIQEISARIGRVTGVGIAGNIRQHYPRLILYIVVLLMLSANIFNLGADVGAMGAAFQLLVPGCLAAYIVLFGGFSLALQVFVPYTKYVRYLKWSSRWHCSPTSQLRLSRTSLACRRHAAPCCLPYRCERAFLPH